MAFSVAHPEIDSKMSRAYYGIDVMVNEDLEAKLLEVTFSPDMERFTIFQPDGYNEIFNCMFFNEQKNITKIIWGNYNQFNNIGFQYSFYQYWLRQLKF